MQLAHPGEILARDERGRQPLPKRNLTKILLADLPPQSAQGPHRVHPRPLSQARNSFVLCALLSIHARHWREHNFLQREVAAKDAGP